MANDISGRAIARLLSSQVGFGSRYREYSVLINLLAASPLEVVRALQEQVMRRA